MKYLKSLLVAYIELFLWSTGAFICFSLSIFLIPFGPESFSKWVNDLGDFVIEYAENSKKEN